jgi:hypothetical protein
MALLQASVGTSSFRLRQDELDPAVMLSTFGRGVRRARVAVGSAVRDERRSVADLQCERLKCGLGSGEERWKFDGNLSERIG